MRVETHDKRNDSPLKERVDQIRVELDALLVDGIVAATKRNDPRPSDRKTETGASSLAVSMGHACTASETHTDMTSHRTGLGGQGPLSTDCRSP